MQRLHAVNHFVSNVFHDGRNNLLLRHLFVLFNQPSGILATKGVFTISSQTEVPGEAEEIQTVLTSQAFSEAPLLARLLKFLCDNRFNQNKSSLNEYRIGVEALGRPADFDPAKNSSVRVEMHRLRQRLRKYYETEGADHRLRITLVEGRYELQFIGRENAFTAPSSKSDEPGGPGEGQEESAAQRHVPIGKPHTAVNSVEKQWRSRIDLISTKSLAIVGAVMIALATFYWMFIGARPGARLTHTPIAHTPSAFDSSASSTAVNGPVRILAGYSKEKYLGREGEVWDGDRFFSGGEAVELKLPFIQGTEDPTMYRTARVGEFSYDIPAKPGNYELRLHFVETTFGPGTFTGRGESSRVFSVSLGGQPLLINFDILSDAGGNYRAFTRVFKGVSPGSDGMIHLAFHRIFDQPMVNAIELVPEFGGKLNPVRIVMQQNSYVDHAGGIWSSDQYAIGGILATHQDPAATATDSHLFDGERFGHFDYQIPVAPGRYAVTLYFVESYIGAAHPRNIEEERLFDVYANGVALLRDFDIFKNAGGPNKPVTQTFHNIAPNAAGLIVLSFVPVKNYACVSAIEVTDESP
jgi:hypothetical protein